MSQYRTNRRMSVTGIDENSKSESTANLYTLDREYSITFYLEQQTSRQKDRYIDLFPHNLGIIHPIIVIIEEIVRKYNF